MSAAAGPNIIEDGLALCLDAANTESYPGTGNLWRDLANNNHFTLINPSYYSFDSINKSIGFTRTLPPENEDAGYAEITVTNSSPLAAATYLYNDHTTELFAKINDLNPTNYNATENLSTLFVYRGYHSMFYYNSSTLFYTIWNGITNAAVVSIPIGGNQQIRQNTWFHIAATRSSNTITIYVNGRLRTQNIITPPSNVGIGTVNIIRFGVAHLPPINFSWTSNTNIACARMYNRALSPEEILQNYNAIKSRYLI